MKLLSSFRKGKKNTTKDSFLRWMSRQKPWKWRRLTLLTLMVCRILTISRLPMRWLSFVSIACKMKHFETLWKRKNTLDISKWQKMAIIFHQGMAITRDPWSKTSLEGEILSLKKTFLPRKKCKQVAEGSRSNGTFDLTKVKHSWIAEEISWWLYRNKDRYHLHSWPLSFFLFSS